MARPHLMIREWSGSSAPPVLDFVIEFLYPLIFHAVRRH